MYRYREIFNVYKHVVRRAISTESTTFRELVGAGGVGFWGGRWWWGSGVDGGMEGRGVLPSRLLNGAISVTDFPRVSSFSQCQVIRSGTLFCRAERLLQIDAKCIECIAVPALGSTPTPHPHHFFFSFFLFRFLF